MLWILQCFIHVILDTLALDYTLPPVRLLEIGIINHQHANKVIVQIALGGVAPQCTGAPGDSLGQRVE